MTEVSGPDAALVVDGGEVAELEMLTRALVGITLQSLEVLGGEVSLPQFRLLLAAEALGRVPSSRLAGAVGIPASSVTRLADRLEAAGLLARGTDARSRSIVTIEITGAGRDLVARVVARRHELLEAVLARMAPAERAAAAAAAARFTALAAGAAERGAAGPLPVLRQLLHARREDLREEEHRERPLPLVFIPAVPRLGRNGREPARTPH